MNLRPYYCPPNFIPHPTVLISFLHSTQLVSTARKKCRSMLPAYAWIIIPFQIINSVLPNQIHLQSAVSNIIPAALPYLAKNPKSCFPRPPFRAMSFTTHRTFCIMNEFSSFYFTSARISQSPTLLFDFVNADPFTFLQDKNFL